MILNYIDGCTADNLTIDGVEAGELPPYEIAECKEPDYLYQYDIEK